MNVYFVNFFVKKEDIALTIAQKYNVPLEKILASEQQKLFFLPAILQKEIKGNEIKIQALTMKLELLEGNLLHITLY